jgi:hypothetical protein
MINWLKSFFIHDSEWTEKYNTWKVLGMRRGTLNNSSRYPEDVRRTPVGLYVVVFVENGLGERNIYSFNTDEMVLHERCSVFIPRKMYDLFMHYNHNSAALAIAGFSHFSDYENTDLIFNGTDSMVSALKDFRKGIEDGRYNVGN